eukprot:323627-Prorocentrum_lima.AAC.1
MARPLDGHGCPVLICLPLLLCQLASRHPMPSHDALGQGLGHLAARKLSLLHSLHALSQKHLSTTEPL